VKYPRRIGFGMFLSNTICCGLIFGGISSAVWYGVQWYQGEGAKKTFAQNQFWMAMDDQYKYSSTSSAGQFVAELKPLLPDMEVKSSSRLELSPIITCNEDCYPNLQDQVSFEPFISYGDDKKTLTKDFLEELDRFERGGLSAVRKEIPWQPMPIEKAWPWMLACSGGFFLLMGTGSALKGLLGRRRHPNRHRIESALRDLQYAKRLPPSAEADELKSRLRSLISKLEEEPDDEHRERLVDQIRVLDKDVRDRLKDLSDTKKARESARDELRI
jgi:hypothetical protein